MGERNWLTHHTSNVVYFAGSSPVPCSKVNKFMKTIICEQCHREHDGSYGSGKFCSFECKQKHNSKSSSKIHICQYCHKEFLTGAKLGSHVRGCKENPSVIKRRQKQLKDLKEKQERDNPLIDYHLKCKNCQSEYILSIRQKDFEKGSGSKSGTSNSNFIINKQRF